MDRRDAPLIADMEAAGLHPVWDRFKTLTPMIPNAPDDAGFWPWRDIAPFADRAAQDVPMEDAERRAMILVNPGFGGQTVTTGTMIGAFTVLQPGDKARPHRHTMSALRFATGSKGAVTLVNGRRCEMLPGDLIVTPPMSWHGHINESDDRVTWFDAANSPLLRSFDANFFEGGNSDADDFWNVDEGEEPVWTGAGLVPDGLAAKGNPKYRYPGEETRRVLDRLPAGDDGARTLRYTNPVTGGSVLPTMDCLAMRLAPGVETRARRSTWNVMCLVVSGSGSSTVGNRTFTWEKNDVFTIPHWTWASHRADGQDADLFLVTDQAAYEALGLARNELA